MLLVGSRLSKNSQPVLFLSRFVNPGPATNDRAKRVLRRLWTSHDLTMKPDRRSLEQNNPKRSSGVSKLRDPPKKKKEREKSVVLSLTNFHLLKNIIFHIFSCWFSRGSIAIEHFQGNENTHEILDVLSPATASHEKRGENTRQQKTWPHQVTRHSHGRKKTKITTAGGKAERAPRREGEGGCPKSCDRRDIDR